MKAIFDDALKGAFHDFDAAAPVEETVDYKQVATLGVGSLAAAVVATLGFFWTPFIGAAILGVALGVLAQRKIMKAPEEVGGSVLTTIGLVASSVLLVATSGWRVYAYYGAAPPGYEVVEFDSMGLDKDGRVPSNIVELNGRKIYLTGYMYPTKKHAGIENFTLVRTLGHCQYCSPGTNPADMIAVSMERGQAVKYRANKTVSIGGVLYVDPDFRDKTGAIPYSIKASVFR